MSKVYSFRLNEDNPREAQARKVIEDWVKEGYSLSGVIVDALINHQLEKTGANNYDTLLEKIQDLIDNTRKTKDDFSQNASFSYTFKSGIMKSVKKGIHV